MRIRHVISGVAVALAVAIIPAAAFADIYLNIPGISGASVEANHKGWIDVISFSFGTPNAAAPANSQPGRIAIVKALDSASPALLRAVTSGQHFATVQLAVLKPGGGQAYLTYTFSDVLISGIQTTTGSAKPEQTLSLSFTKFEMLDQGGSTPAVHAK